MQISKLKELCLEQANFYYEYVKKFSENNGKSIDKVVSINYQKDSFPKLYEIKLEKPIYDFEKTYYKNNQTNEYYFNKKDILIKEYDEKNRLLYLQVLNSDIEFEKIKSDDFLVVTDLLFLIKNIIEWYDKNSHKLTFNDNLALNLKPNFEILKDTKLNQNQIDAVSSIFKNSYSYIWGAPGTGKTKAVLSTALINYIFQNKKVLIVAPTNVALEQILFGVLENTEKLQISREKVLRLGIPSKDFFDKYSEVCETKGIERVLESLENEINILSRVIKYREGKSISDDLEKILEHFLKLQENKEKIIKLEYEEEQLQPLINLLTLPLKAYHFSNNSKMIKDAIKKHEKSPCVNFDEKLIEEGRLKEVVNLDCVRKELEKIDENINKINQENFEILTFCKNLIKSEKIYNEIFKDLNQTNLDEKQVQINEKISQLNLWCKTSLESIKTLVKESNDELINQALDIHHKDFDDKKLKKKLAFLIDEKDLLIEQSTKQRVKNSLVLAMTIDAYIQYTINENIEVDHIFCDEAGYMSTIKALSLFKSNSPITFLGDHMQLPPVSEIKTYDINAYKKSFLWSQSALFFETLFLKNSVEEIFFEFTNNTTPKFEKTSQVNLISTHRFGENLAQVLNKFVYKFGFKSALNSDTNLFFIDSASNIDEAIERSSLEEVLIIKELVKKFEGKSFVILTPYKKQVQLLKEQLGRKYFENIMTIHKSQGSEWDNVIFSVVDDSNSGKRKMFFTDTLNENFKGLNLINTVVSRTKRRLIIVANEEFWIKQKDAQLIGNLIFISKKVTV
ncbi:MAG: AAA domain-containing protein [Arcobacter sp.]|uniref:AAA domain-containing protein n=1 Tax=Arcobacter sp. TaxID=1872629 RepID=UPI0025850C45|nr:AAA domain-containing protein [Arcobacter sp.]MDD3009230.1 AAA domain-containing protein [Arcobacter sp.]